MSEVPEEIDDEKVANAVVVHRIDDGKGGVAARVEMVGDVRATEIESLLKMGLNEWRARVGLTE